LGQFGKYGLDPKFIVMDSASAATTARIAKSINLAVSGRGELVIAWGRGQQVVVTVNTTWAPPFPSPSPNHRRRGSAFRHRPMPQRLKAIPGTGRPLKTKGWCPGNSSANF
jgi:hypothetical protein